MTRHTVRGLISGALKKKLGLHVLSEATDRGRLTVQVIPEAEVHGGPSPAAWSLSGHPVVKYHDTDVGFRGCSKL
jgi:hypothetical protein